LERVVLSDSRTSQTNSLDQK